MQVGFTFVRRVPFIKILLPFIAGIACGWELKFPFHTCIIIFLISLLAFLLFTLIPTFNRFKYNYVQGVFLFLLFFSFGAASVTLNDPIKRSSWFGNYVAPGNRVLAIVEEPLSEKPRSYKAIASITGVITKNSSLKTNGRIIIYFSKDSSNLKVDYGSRLLIAKPLQSIQNFSNETGFDYRRYCYFQGISHQVYLTSRHVNILPGEEKSLLRQFVFDVRKKILSILERYIVGEKELGLAEALLIGYKHDLDKQLMQSYSNTGVVHVIAISGLHLGLIYWLLVKLFAPLRRVKRARWLVPVIIITFLWFFSILCGAQPSVLRSALMFTCIVLGENLTRRTSIYNTLAVSAFILLCWNPFWLWDVGFQLSYSAVLSIVLFMKPVYNWFYLKNKILDQIWKLNAVTISAQVLTLPLCLFHFNQFPNLFLLTNLIAVPLSSLILLLEILLCIVYFLPGIAALLGELISLLIGLMNQYIEGIDDLPFATWRNIHITAWQTITLYIIITCISLWLLEKKRTALIASLVVVLVCLILRTVF